MPDLLSSAEMLAQTADRLGASFARELATVKEDLDRELRRLVREAAEGSRTAQAQAGRAIALRSQVREVLTAAGFDDLAEASTVTGLERMVRAVEQLRVVAQAAAFTSRDATRIAALKELARLNVLAQGDEVAIALWRSLVQGVFSARSAVDILDDLAEALDQELPAVRTLYDTTVSIFGRQIEAMKSTGAPDEKFLFAGPVDAKMRPFCARHVGKVRTREAIDGLDNGQIPNVFLTGGGYNCRHTWVAVSRFSPLQDLGEGERAPEFADAFDDVKARLKLTQRAA
jgi:hypothetical protein